MARRRKRANGEGTVCQRKDGRWIAAATLGRDQNGRPVRRTVYGGSQREAREKLDRLRADAAGGAGLPLANLGAKRSQSSPSPPWCRSG